MKSRTKQSLMRRVNSQSSFTTTCKPSDTGTSCQLLHRTVGQHLSIVLFLLLSMGVGLGTATAQAQTRAYVANRSNTVSVIDTATNTVVATIPVGQGPWEVAITPDGTRAYVTNAFSNTVSVIDTATNTVVATIPVGALGVAITPDGTRAYVTNGSSAVSVIDTATNTVVATIPVGVKSFWGSHHAGWNPSLRDQVLRQHCLGHRHRDQHRGCDHPCWDIAFGGSHHAGWNPSLRDQWPLTTRSRSSTPRPTPWLRPFLLGHCLRG